MNTAPESESAKARNTANTLVVALLVIAALGALLWWWYQRTPPGLRDVTETAQPPRTAKPVETAPPPDRNRPAQKEAPERPERPEQPAFPTAESVRFGMEKSELLERFGKPNMATTSVEQGQEMETLVYLRRGPPKKETVVVLKNGSVVSVNSVSPKSVQ